ncbi:unnamed protein product, partial [Iphiclides podalirius]
MRPLGRLAVCSPCARATWRPCARQSCTGRGRNMSRLPLLLLFAAAHSCASAYVTEPPSFARRLDRLYEKLERFTLAPVQRRDRLGDKLNAKLDKLDALAPDRLDEDEELATMMQLFGDMSDEQVRDVVKELQKMKELPDDEKGDKLADGDYAEDWNDADTLLQDLGEGDYAMDGEDWHPLDDPEVSTFKPGSVVPSAITKIDSGYREVVLSAVDPVAATNERPRILDDSNLTPAEKAALQRSVVANMKTVLRTGTCQTPQPRWLPVRQLAPAANTVYIPACVQLHRCAPDAGCCYSEAEVCAPVDGKHVAIPFFLSKVDGTLTVARMLFFNHTSCACVSRETLQSTARARIEPQPITEGQKSKQEGDWRQPTEEPRLERDEERTAPPQLKRCTCPMLFAARTSALGACLCTCEWADAGRRRDCQSLARGREHFGLRDRVCVQRGECSPPGCDAGRYEPALGRCPPHRPRPYRRVRFHRARPRADGAADTKT